MQKREIDNNTSSVLTKKLSINRIIEIEKYGVTAQGRSEHIVFLQGIAAGPVRVTPDTWGSS